MVECSEALQCMEEEVCGWRGHSMTAMEPTTFTVKIGPSGGLRGYQYITGNYVLFEPVSWLFIKCDWLCENPPMFAYFTYLYTSQLVNL